jgi:uncharacterized membrane protein YtjA (UPF0391 family)
MGEIQIRPRGGFPHWSTGGIFHTFGIPYSKWVYPPLKCLLKNSKLLLIEHRVQYWSFSKRKRRKECSMDLLQWAIIAFGVAILAGLFGFTGVAGGAAAVGRTLFGLFMVLAVIFLVLSLLGISILV